MEYLQIDKTVEAGAGTHWEHLGKHAAEEIVEEAAKHVAHKVAHHLAPPPLPKKVLQWFYALEDESKGPVDEDELLRLVAQGVIIPSSLVWNKTMAEWAKFADTRLAARAAQGPPPLPPVAKPAVEKVNSAAGVCPSCGHASGPTDRFCPECGSPL